MTPGDPVWPDGLARNVVCFTVDVEWAAPAVLDDVRGLFDAHGVAATFFVTHGGISLPGHERGLHPNFTRRGDTYRSLACAGKRSDVEVQTHVIETTLGFAPEAKGVRAHSLHYDSALLPLYRRFGLEYDCTYQLPFMTGLRPIWKHDGILEIPTYYGDHLDLLSGATQFRVPAFRLEETGVKVLCFHPNIVYLNAARDVDYHATKEFFHDPDRLLAARHQGRGMRTMLIDLLEHVRSRGIATTTLGDVNRLWRSASSPT